MEIPNKTKELWVARFNPVRALMFLGGLSLLSGFVASCSNQPLIVLPNSTDSTSAASNTSQKSAGAEAVSSPISLDFVAPSASQSSFVTAVSTLKVVSILGSGVFSGFSPLGVATVELKNGVPGTPVVIKVPSFAQGQTFLPVSSDGSDFWLVRENGGTREVIRPSTPVAGSVPAELSEHWKVSLTGAGEVLGFNEDLVVLSGSASVWMVKRGTGKLNAYEIPLPSGAANPVSAGGVFGDTARFWIAEPTALWMLAQDGDGWRVRKHVFQFKNAKESLKLLAMKVQIAEGVPKATGVVVGMFGSQVLFSGMNGASVPSNTTQLTAMTFSEAAAKCDPCHSSSSANAAAKAKLVGTENLSTWIMTKDDIVNAVDADVMPKTKLIEPEKTRFLMFAKDPK